MIVINIIGLYQFLDQAEFSDVSPTTETGAKRRNFIFFVMVYFYFFSLKLQLKD